MKIRVGGLFVFLILFSSFTQAKEQHFKVVFRGINAGTATLSIPDVLTFPSMLSNKKTDYEVILLLKPNVLANIAGATMVESSSKGEMSADKTFPALYLQQEDGKKKIQGIFKSNHVVVTDHKKRKNKTFQVDSSSVYDPLSLILQLQQDLKYKNNVKEYTVVDDKRLNVFLISTVELPNNSKQITLKSKTDDSIFRFEFNVALDLQSMTKLKGEKKLFSIQSD